MRTDLPPILVIFIEPTPYILGLIEALKQRCSHPLEIIFLAENISQPWELSLNGLAKILPSSPWKKFISISRLVFQKNYARIHVAGWGHRLFLWVILLAKIRGIPVSVESDTPLSHALPIWKKMIKRLLYPIFFKLFDLYLPGGTRQARYFEHYAADPQRIFPVQMTVDVAHMQRVASTLTEADRIEIRNKYGIKKEDRVFLYVGRLISHKGVHELLAAFQQLASTNVVLLIAGDGSLRSIVEEAAKQHPHIRYAGRLSNRELIPLYFASDVFVLPSHQEPWGLVINEAMAMGLPIITTDQVGCVDDLVKHQHTGLVIRSACINELKNAMEEMLQSPQQRQVMKQNALEIISSWTLENEAALICQAWQTK